ncbi:MAG: UDP-N-acetylglucosamine 1-carboxyvinyltransferase [Acidimicrobiales bacterium]
MDRFVIRPAGPLHGSVTIQGAKNSALKLMAATLLAEGTFTLRNVPRITDVDIMAEVLVSMGVGVERRADGALVIDRTGECVPEAPYELVERIRASIVVLGPLLARFGRARVAMPGGDNFGTRPIDFHLRGLEELGARFDLAHGVIDGRADGLIGARIVLDFPSVTATENILMAAVLAKGTTVIDNAAREPETADLAAFLNRMGAIVEGAGTSTITVEGVETLGSADHDVIPDRVEAATYLAAVGVAGGEVTLCGARAEHMDMLLHKLGAMGVRVAETPDGLWVTRAGDRLSAADVATLPYPGVATDYKPLLVAMLAVADGVGVVTENLFASSRYAYVAELLRMGADITLADHHAVVRGVRRLSGAPVKAPDIRAGAALVVAGLVADGETIVYGGDHLDRGYEDMAAKFVALGADVRRGT